MSLILIGAPGSGKGTISKQLQHFGFFPVVTGQLYRKAYEQKTELGILAHSYWVNGNICPDDMTNELMRSTIVNNPSLQFVFDGYPRTVVQAKFLDSIVKVDLALDLNISDDVAVKRLLNRNEGRVDDTEEIIRKRLEVYHTNNDPMVCYYSSDLGRYKVIDAGRTKDEVFEDVMRLILKMEG